MHASYEDMTGNLKAMGVYRNYANLLGNMGQLTDAIEQYKAYIKAFPNDANAYKNLGLVYKKQNDIELALFNLEKSYTLDPSDNDTKKACPYLDETYEIIPIPYSFNVKNAFGQVRQYDIFYHIVPPM